MFFFFVQKSLFFNFFLGGKSSMRVLQEYELASGVCMYLGIGFSGCAQRGLDRTFLKNPSLVRET